MASSASPVRIVMAALATASKPDGQAVDTVAACARTPIRSAMALAAACGFNAEIAVGDMPRKPCRSKSLIDRSIMSIALVLTPTTTGVGLGKSASLISKPASFSAIIVTA